MNFTKNKTQVGLCTDFAEDLLCIWGCMDNVYTLWLGPRIASGKSIWL